MARYAVISDVHGNRWALEAVLADLRRRQVDALLQLGDAVYGPLDPHGTAAILRAPGLPVHHIGGNQDRIVYEEDADTRANSSLAFTRQALDEADLAWLRDLPGGAVVGDVRLCHGTPGSDEKYLLERVTEHGVGLRDIEGIERLVGAVQERVLLCGHTHVPRLVSLASGLVIVNPGSVGLPAYTDQMPYPHRMESGSTHARYAVVDVGDSVTVDLIGVAYDGETAATTALRNGRPDWAVALRTGRAGSM
ncbi:metallophosphoesterase family protein [Pendulispora albinea]|uniref:Metallophosphatase family protein n=1 Tax=Pendulispora albinea TaxID=2741071 RepID=A0ABZ2LUG9_9BACT